jgi:hypothetical protein
MDIILVKIVKNYKWGYKKLIDEAVFDTHIEGMKWLKDEFFCDEYYDNEYSAEIDRYYITVNKSKIMKISSESYTFFGKRLTPPGVDKSSDEEPGYNRDFIPKFSKGDLVVFKNFIESNNGSFQDTIAVVSGVPLTLDERKAGSMRTEELDFTDQMYMIEYITDCGLLVHNHILEKDLIPFEKVIPEELKALEYLSQHFKGERPIKTNILQAMMSGEIYMLNRKTWHEVI